MPDYLSVVKVKLSSDQYHENTFNKNVDDNIVD